MNRAIAVAVTLAVSAMSIAVPLGQYPKTPTFAHQDQQGSNRVLSDSTGAIVGTAKWDEYGRLTNLAGSTSPLGYDGQYTDAESGLQYLRARYYDPTTAQFISADPIAELTHATYSFADNTPVNEGDPSGLLGGDNSNFQFSTEGILSINPVINGANAINHAVSCGIHSPLDAVMLFLSVVPGVGKGFAAAKTARGILLSGEKKVASAVEKDIAGAVQKDLANAAEKDAKGVACGMQSFSADTEVLMADGSRKPISQVQVGDSVLATDTKTGEKRAQTVTALWLHNDDNLMNVTVQTSSGQSVIQATTTHPFWDVTLGAWVAAADLGAGDELLTADGSRATVASTTVVPGVRGMWDLTVSTDHDFYVGARNAVLVHNLNGANCGRLGNLPEGEWTPAYEYASKVAQDVRNSFRGSPTEVGRHGSGLQASANELRRLANNPLLLPEIRDEMRSIAAGWAAKARTINHPNRR